MGQVQEVHWNKSEDLLNWTESWFYLDFSLENSMIQHDWFVLFQKHFTFYFYYLLSIFPSANPFFRLKNLTLSWEILAFILLQNGWIDESLENCLSEEWLTLEFHYWDGWKFWHWKLYFMVSFEKWWSLSRRIKSFQGVFQRKPCLTFKDFLARGRKFSKSCIGS